MFKPTPNPPETDDTTPYEFPGSKKFHEAAERALDHYLSPTARIMGSTHEPEPMFLANPKYDTESLLANASETLGSATTLLNNFLEHGRSYFRGLLAHHSSVCLFGLRYQFAGFRDAAIN